MRRARLIVTFIVFLYSFDGLGQMFQTTGNWNTGSNWSSGSVPSGSTTDVSVQNNRNPTLNAGAVNSIGSISIGTSVILTISTGASMTVGSSSQFNATPTQDKRSITVTNSATLNVNTGASGDGLLEIWGDLIVGTSLQMNIRGNLIIHGNLVMSNSGQVAVTGGGTITVGGNFTGGTNSQLTVTGGGSTITVSGALALSNSSQITTSGGGSITATSCSCTGCAAFCGSVTLPIELLYFKATNDLNKISLFWATASELNFDYFDIEKSSEGKSFQSIAKVKGNGTTTQRNDYFLDDEKPYIGKNYYRLKSVDFDGYTEYFKVVMIDFDGSKAFSISPNPSDGIIFNVETNFVPLTRAFVAIYSRLGSEIAHFEVAGNNSELTLPIKLASGIYYAKYISGDFTSINRVVVH